MDSGSEVAVSGWDIICDELGVRQRVAGFMSQSPLDGKVTQRVKMAANVIDRFGYAVS